MAGIGIELRRLLEKDSFFGMLRAYTYAGVISSGPWIISILAMLFVGIFSLMTVSPKMEVAQFLVTVTYQISASLILTGLVQQAYTRYISDELYLERFHVVTPTYLGLSFITTIASFILSFLFVVIFFRDISLAYRAMFVATFVILCNVWIAAVLLSGMKKYKNIVATFFIGYATVLVVALSLRPYGLEGLFFGFFLGHLILLIGLMYSIIQEYPAERFFSLSFFDAKKVYWTLVGAGFFFNVGLWADKYTFWFNPMTSEQILGPLRASPLYDFPIFIAYLSIIPGMAVFLVRVETDFVEYYNKFFHAVLHGGSLSHIREMQANMVLTARQAIFEIIKIQAIAVLVVFVMGPTLLSALNIPGLYVHLLNIDIVAVGLQVVLLGIVNILFYLDKRMHALIITVLFAILNVVFTQISINLGAYFFGYGFAFSLLCVIVVGMYLLNKDLDNIEYETFMLQASI